MFRKTPRLMQRVCAPRKQARLAVGFTGEPGMTLAVVNQVSQARLASQVRIDAILDAMDACVLQAQRSLEAGYMQNLGSIMDENHRLLQALNVSSPSLEYLIAIARDNGALGANLTGGGGGGAMIALVDNDGSRIARACKNAGFALNAVRL
jgi:hydroxymethylglutaryl-CoA reductase